MSRRSAVATDTGTTGATFARAEAGLGSLPPQADKHTLSSRMSPSTEFASVGSRRTCIASGCRKVELCPSCAASGLPEAVVIRRPLSAGKHDEFNIVVIVLVQHPRVGRLNPNSGCGLLSR